MDKDVAPCTTCSMMHSTVAPMHNATAPIHCSTAPVTVPWHKNTAPWHKAQCHSTRNLLQHTMQCCSMPHNAAAHCTMPWHIVQCYGTKTAPLHEGTMLLHKKSTHCTMPQHIVPCYGTKHKCHNTNQLWHKNSPTSIKLKIDRTVGVGVLESEFD